MLRFNSIHAVNASQLHNVKKNHPKSTNLRRTLFEKHETL